MINLLQRTSIRDVLKAVPTTERNIASWIEGFFQRIDDALPKDDADVVNLNKTDLNAAVDAVKKLQARLGAYDIQRDVIHAEAVQVQEAITLAFEANSEAKRKLLADIDDLDALIDAELRPIGRQLSGLPHSEALEDQT